MPDSDNTTVYIEAADSVGTIVIDGRSDSGVVIIGNEEISVVVDDSDLVASESPEPLNVTVTENPVTVILTTPELTVIGSDVPGPPGPAGPPGAGGGDADEIAYDNATYSTVQAALDALLYVAPHIASFTNSVGTVEIGTTVSAVTLAWTLNKTMTSLALDHGIGSVLGLASKSLTGLTLTTDTTYTLTAGDGQNTTSAQTTIAFRNRRYWGAVDSESLDNAGILALSSEFATDYQKSVTYDATGGKYLYYAFPASFGTPSHVTVGGLSFSDFTVSAMSFTNASGHTETYNVIRLNNRQTGSAIAIVWA
jgi:hypothetical protein